MSEVAQVVVELDGQRHCLSWPPGQTLVDMLLDSGIDVPHPCRAGRCGSCVATVIEGEVDVATCDILETDDLRDGLILACQAWPASAYVHIEILIRMRPLTGIASGYGTDCGRPLLSPPHVRTNRYERAGS